jgi:cell wall assembly regulator SMI1
MMRLPMTVSCVAVLLFISAEASVAAPPKKVSSIVSAKRQPTKPTDAQAVQAEREEIWNSPDMLRARAWLKDYCSKSAKVTPEMAKQYETELQNMTPNQMRIYLMKFDEQEQVRQQQYAMFQQQNSMGLQAAAAMHKQTQQGYAAINQAETSAATQEESNINEQRESEQNAQQDAMFGGNLYGYPYGYNGGYGGPYGYGGAIEYHYHFH